jgi:hypothetical protein
VSVSIKGSSLFVTQCSTVESRRPAAVLKTKPNVRRWCCLLTWRSGGDFNDCSEVPLDAVFSQAVPCNDAWLLTVALLYSNFAVVRVFHVHPTQRRFC